MSEQRYSYGTVGVNDEREEPVIVLGKEKATFEVGGEEFERTATLRLPERMNESELNQWKSREGVDLIDMYFHCLHQKPIPSLGGSDDPEDAGGGDSDRPEEEAETVAADGGNEQSKLVADGGEESLGSLKMGSTPLINETTYRLVIDGEVAFEERVEPGTEVEFRSESHGEPLRPRRLVTDGGEEEPIPGEELLPEEEIEHRCRCARNQLGILHEKAERHFPTSAGFIEGVLDDVDEAEEMVKSENPVNPPVTDGGSSMPKLSLQTLKQLKEADAKIGEWLPDQTGDDIENVAGLYRSEHSIEEAMNDIELGEGFSLKEPEFIELLGMLETAREAAANDPPTLGVRNRLLMQVILANPEAYARVKKEEAERAAEAQEEARQRFNEAMGRQRMNERMADLNDGMTDIPIDGDEPEEEDA